MRRQEHLAQPGVEEGEALVGVEREHGGPGRRARCRRRTRRESRRSVGAPPRARPSAPRNPGGRGLDLAPQSSERRLHAVRRAAERGRAPGATCRCRPDRDEDDQHGRVAGRRPRRAAPTAPPAVRRSHGRRRRRCAARSSATRWACPCPVRLRMEAVLSRRP